MRSTTHARAGPSHVAAETMKAATRTPRAIRMDEASHRRRCRSTSTWSSSSSSNSNSTSLLRRSLLRSSVAASAASDDDNNNVPPPARSQEDAETEPVLVLPRTMLLPEADENFDDLGVPMVAPNSSSPSEPPPPLPFTSFGLDDSEVSRWALKSNFSGKMAVLALAAMLIGERITGRGAVQALDLAVGVPLWEIEPVLALVVGGLLLAGLTPPRERPPPGTPPVPLKATIQAFMLRAAHLGLAAAIVSEVATGQGALSLLELETGLGEVSELEAAAAFVLLVLLTNPGKGDKSSRQGDGGE